MDDLLNIPVGETIREDYEGQDYRFRRSSETDWEVFRIDSDGQLATIAEIERLPNDEYPWMLYPRSPLHDQEEYSNQGSLLRDAFKLPIPLDDLY